MDLVCTPFPTGAHISSGKWRVGGGGSVAYLRRRENREQRACCEKKALLCCSPAAERDFLSLAPKPTDLFLFSFVFGWEKEVKRHFACG